MSFQLNMLAYPWDLADGDAGESLARLRGEVGLDGLCVWAAIPPVLQLRAGQRTPRVFSTPGGVFFPPRDSMFARLHMSPVVSTWVRAKDPLDDARKLCERHGLALRIVVSASRAGRMAERYPELATRNAFGAESSSTLCLAHPDVQAYLVALLGNLQAAYAPQAIVLTDFLVGWPEACSDALQTPAPLDERAREVLSVCFCEACRKDAKVHEVDADLARNAAADVVTRSWDDSEVPTVARAALDAFGRGGSRTCGALLERLTAACGASLIIDQGDAPLSPVSTPSIVAMKSAESLPEIAEACRGPWELRLRADWTLGEKGPALVRLLADAAERGASGATIDNLGLLPDAGIKFLKQAARFARRTAVRISVA